jgi:DNA repair exonuclease SbcCD ATPase subunit
MTTRTPTPRPRLSGGFGRPAAKPVASESTGQSLSDVVRAAEESKGHKEQKSGVAITNESLVTDPRKGKITTSSPRNVPPPTAAKSTETSPSAVTPTSANGAEAEWRGRAQSARSRVQELKQRVSQLEGEAKKLESDFYAWDDGSYRDGVIKPAWDRKKEELETSKKDLAQAEADLADLPEKARRAGALPGWLRE